MEPDPKTDIGCGDQDGDRGVHADQGHELKRHNRDQNVQWCHLADSLSQSLIGGDAAIAGTLVRFRRSPPRRQFTGIKDLGHFLTCGGVAPEELPSFIQQLGRSLFPRLAFLIQFVDLLLPLPIARRSGLGGFAFLIALARQERRNFALTCSPDLNGPGHGSISFQMEFTMFASSEKHFMNKARFSARNRDMKSPALIVLSLLALSTLSIDPVERFPEYVPWLVPILAREKIAGPVTDVRDGDTIEVRGQAIRFGSLDCAELGTADGRSAKSAMQQLVRGQSLACHVNGRRSHDRWIGSCMLPDGKDLAGIMIARHICRRYW